MNLGQLATPFSQAWFEDHGWEISVTFVIAVVLTVVSRRWVRRYRRKARSGGDDPEGRRRRRTATVVGLFSGVIVIIAWCVFGLTMLKALGVDITPLLASAGIVGLALGFGAQSLVRDTISGLFIFVEGQYDVGDIVDLTTGSQTVSGTVEALNLRTTAVRQYDGSLSTVPNGLVEVSNNRTRGWGRAVVDIRVALNEDPDRVREVIERMLEEIRDQPPLGEWLRQPPVFLGVTQLTDTAQVVRIAAETMPSHRVDTERLLREKLVARMADEGLRQPPVGPTPPSATVS